MDIDIRKPSAEEWNLFKDRVDTIKLAPSNQNKDIRDSGSSYFGSTLTSKKTENESSLKKLIGNFRSLGLDPSQDLSTLQEDRSKKIQLPTRVEPKVFFANERTFLSWLHFSVIISTLSLGLLNFGDKVSRVSAMIFTFVASLFMIYSLFLYQFRAYRIRNKELGPYGRCFVYFQMTELDPWFWYLDCFLL